MFALVLQRLGLQFILDVVLFPVWWYKGGLRRVLIALSHSLQDTNRSLAPGLWLKHIFTPMYGQTDIQGRLMSFFMRVVNVIGRSIALLVWLIILFCLLCLWFGIPLFLMYMIVHVLSI